MALEDLTGTKYIDSLNSSNPTATDAKSEGDDHLRGIKNTLKNSFPGVTGAVTATHAELNLLDGGFPTVQNNLQIYAGYVDAAATAEILPSGWSAAWDAGNSWYTITHNLGLGTATSELSISITPLGGAAKRNGAVFSSSANSFIALVWDETPSKVQNAFFVQAIKIV